ncbi:hypothetical protein NP493_298g03029 [Ridgeia piscesae]|uniref:Uncharacterized protein n=1 Tax=Ridgeia piscesae TaxID=27915 RepID=A0AAD9L5V3_RIDPI|nr:hypothetical protein NP493_298g03029 [Ridgeia piscesae]
MPSDKANVRDPRSRQTLYDRLPRHYPGVWMSADSLKVADIVARVTRPTIASVSRADACIRHRRHIYRIRSAGLAADIGLKEQQRSVGREAVYPQHAVSPRLPSTPVCYATVSF